MFGDVSASGSGQRAISRQDAEAILAEGHDSGEFWPVGFRRLAIDLSGRVLLQVHCS